MSGSCNDIAMFKWLVEKFWCDETACVCNISHQIRSARVCNFSELCVVIVSWISTSSAYNHLWFEFLHLFGQCFIVNQSILFFNVVWLTFKIDAGCWNLFGLCLMTMSQMTSMSKWESHDSITWLQKGCVNCKVCWWPGQWLNIDGPFLWVETICSKSSLLAKSFHLIDEFITSIISLSWISLWVLVAKTRAHGLHDSLRGEVLTCNKFEATELPLFFKSNDLSNFRILVYNIKILHWQWFGSLHFVF